MPFPQDNALAIILNQFNQCDYPVHSRVHPLKTFQNSYVKREDELGFGIAGSKIRKYRTLIPYFIQNGIDQVVVIGGANSNHVLSVTQLLIENGIKPHLFLRGNSQELFGTKKPLGNLFFLQFFIEPDMIHWVSRQDWPNCREIAVKRHPGVFILEEGGMAKEALPGALTLKLDIKRNEEKSGVIFKNIFIDSGTGFTAIALLLGNAFLKSEAVVHVLLLADDEYMFLQKLKKCHREFEEIFQVKCPYPDRFFLHIPQNAKSFGSTNRKIFEEIEELAKHEGFLTDPVYSGKLFLESKNLIDEKSISGTSLIIHSGGALTLTGFHNKFAFGER